MPEDKRDTPATLRGGEQVSTKLLSLTRRAKENPKHRFTRLIDLLTEDFLESCFRQLKRDKAVGVDGVTVREYEANLTKNLKGLIAGMKAWKYRPKPVRRVYIPKTGGKKRPLGIPSVEDKILQMGIKRILVPLLLVERKYIKFKLIKTNMILTKRYWVLISLLIILLAGTSIYFGLTKQKSEPVKPQPEQTQPELAKQIIIPPSLSPEDIVGLFGLAPSSFWWKSKECAE